MQEGFKFVCTAQFNQDCLENFFAGLRSKQGWNENPTPFQFSAAFRKAVLLSSLDSTSSGKNCIADGDFMLTQHRCMEAGDVQMQQSRSTSHTQTATVNADDGVWQEITNEVLNSDICYEQGVLEVFSEAEEMLISYLSEWLACKCGICVDCQVVLIKRLGDHSYCRRVIDDFACVKRFAGLASVGLVEPCEELVAAVHKMEECFRLNYSVMYTLPHVAMSLYDIIQPRCNFQFFVCQASYLAQKLIKMYIVMRIFYAVKFEKQSESSHKYGESSCRTATKRKMQKVLHL